MTAVEAGPRVIRRQDWAFYVSLVFVALAGIFHEDPVWAVSFVVGAAFATAVGKLASRRRPQPLPYAQRWMLELTRPFFPGFAVSKALEPSPGDRVLEVGPGTGHHALTVARRLGPKGRLDLIDIEPRMLDRALRRLNRRRIANVSTTVGDARTLRWADTTFDHAYLITVLGEIPDRHAVLAEIHRVIRPGGSLVIGEMALDPDNIPLKDLKREAAEAGFKFRRVFGPRFAYLARFTRR